MDIKDKLKTTLGNMKQIIESKNEKMIKLVTEDGMVNEDARQILLSLVSDMEKVTDELNLKEQDPYCTPEKEKSSGFSFSLPSYFKSPEVQAFIPIQTPTTEQFSSAITALCKEISFKCILCKDSGRLQQKFPLVVVCPISSRFEPDIDFALNGINYKEPFVALVLHSGSESSLPRLPTSTKLANKEKYKNIEFIDVAFTIGAKLYKCPMNENAKTLLQTFFNRFYKK